MIRSRLHRYINRLSVLGSTGTERSVVTPVPGPLLPVGPCPGGAWFERLAERERTSKSRGRRTATPARARDVAELGACAPIEPYRPGLDPRGQRLDVSTFMGVRPGVITGSCWGVHAGPMINPPGDCDDYPPP